jgi:hypothetical protein
MQMVDSTAVAKLGVVAAMRDQVVVQPTFELALHLAIELQLPPEEAEPVDFLEAPEVQLVVRVDRLESADRVKVGLEHRKVPEATVGFPMAVVGGRPASQVKVAPVAPVHWPVVAEAVAATLVAEVAVPI